MRGITLMLFSLCVGCIAIAQTNTNLDQLRRYTLSKPPDAYDSLQRTLTIRYKNNLHYLYPLYQATGWEERFKKQMGERRFNDRFSVYLSMIGDQQLSNKEAIKNYDPLTQNGITRISNYVDQLTQLESIDAKTIITGLAMQTQVVMFGEAYNKPQHRAFTYSLLEDLYKDGYRYLAMETFTNSNGNHLKELNAFTGQYTCEPVGGEMTRKALALGYMLIAYEDTLADMHTPNIRDSIQAQQLFNVFKKDPDAKIVVQAGYGHIAEQTLSDGYKPMAIRLKEMSGIDPLTIDQTLMCDGSNFTEGKLLYETFTQRVKVTEPTVYLFDKKPVSFGQLGYDIVVVHPKEDYINNRPSWLSLNGERKESLQVPSQRNMFMLQAYYLDEYQKDVLGQLVPADQTFITSYNGYYPLYLKPGKYKLVYRDISYRALSEKDIEIK